MNDRRPTELQLAAALQAHLPSAAPAGLHDRIHEATVAVPQQRVLPSLLGTLTDADPVARQRTMLLVAAMLVAAALAGAAVVGALNFPAPTPVPLGGQGPIAFIRDGDLFLAKPDGTGAVPVAHVDGAALSKPQWSPDRRLVAVQTEEPAILLVDVRDGSVRRLTSGSIGAWSSDASALAYFTTNGDIALVDVESGEGRILAARTEGTDGFASDYATFNNEPLAWSPDGRWLLANGSARYPETPFSLIRIDVATGDVKTLDTTEAFYQYQPDWSPDSNSVAFAVYGERRATDTFWVSDLEGRVTSEITDPDRSVQDPDWSPDGEWIAYLAMDGGSGRLMIVRPDGSGRRALAGNVEAIVGWSGDGMTLAYTPPADESRPRELHVVTVDGADRLLPIDGGGEDFTFAALDSDGPPEVPPTLPAGIVVPAPEPPVQVPVVGERLQPDASWGGLAFRTDGGEFDCFVGVLRFPDRFSVVSPGARETSPSPDDPAGPATSKPQMADMCDLQFSPDGTAVIRASQRDASFDIVRIDGTLRSGPFPTMGAPPRWSPGGGWIVQPFCDEEGDCSRAVIMRPDGSGRHELPGTPIWSPGDQIVAVGGPDGSLLVGPGDGTNLTGIGAFPRSISWSPDAESFAFVRDGDAWVAQADGSGTRNLTEFDLGGATAAWWSPDGRWILVVQGQIAWAFSPDGSVGQRLGSDLGPTDGGWGPEWAPAWSPSGEWVAIEHGDQVTVFKTGDWHGVRLEHAWQPAWSLDGRYLAVVGEDGVDVMNPDGTGRVTVSAQISYPPVAWSR